MNVVIILPTYNERENIVAMLEALEAVTGKIKHHHFKILVADDNSPDGTQELVQKFQKTHKNVYLLGGQKLGLGKALLRAMDYATSTLQADVLLQLDSDLSHNPQSIPKFIEAIDNGATFVVGSRYIPGGSIPENWGLHRKIFSVVGNTFVRFGLGHPSVHDWTGGYRALRKEYFENLKDQLQSYGGYVFQIAFLHKAIKNGAKIVEVPIQFTDRRFGHSKIAPSEYIKNIFIYVFKERYHEVRHGSFGKFLVVGTIGFIINTAVLEIMVRMGFHPAIGSVVGAELAIISNFILNNSWTFSHRKISGGKQIAKFLQFNLTSVGAIIIQAGTVALGTHFLGISTYRLFYLLGVGIGLVWNYWMYSHVIWKNK